MDHGAPKSIAVIGVGNVFLSDEGVAAHILREVATRASSDIEIINLELPGPGLVEMLAGRTKVIIVDAVDANAPAGTVYRFRPAEATPGNRGRAHSLHDGDILFYLELAETLGMGPGEVVIIGVQPASLAAGEELTPPVKEAVSEAAGMVLAEIGAGANK